MDENLDLNKVLAFGKFKGRTIGSVLGSNPGYISWAKINAPNLLYSKKKSEAKNTDKPKEQVLKDHEWLRAIKPNYNFLNEGKK